MDELHLDELTATVLECVDLIPPGQVATYGDIALMVGTGPRQVGRVMATHGHLSNWWRVVRADGGSQVADRARVKWDEEGITYRRGRSWKVHMSHHRIGMDEVQKILDRLSLP